MMSALPVREVQLLDYLILLALRRVCSKLHRSMPNQSPPSNDENDELRPVMDRPGICASALSISSVIPSAKYSCAESGQAKVQVGKGGKRAKMISSSSEPSAPPLTRLG